MDMPASAEAVSDSFYAWELRGRGWHSASYVVELEPPHRPFLLLPDASAADDDGAEPAIIEEPLAVEADDDDDDDEDEDDK